MFSRRRQRGTGSTGQERNSSTSLTRRPALYIGSIIVLVIIVVTFVGGGAMGIGTGQTRRLVFGEYRGQEIAYTPGNYFARQVESITQQVRNSGQQQNMQQMGRFIWRQAFNRTLFHEAILYEAKQSGFEVSSERVDRAIVNYPRFQQNGRFSPEAYEQTSSTEKMDIREFLREQVIHQRFVQDKTQGLKTGEPETEFIRNMASPERKFQYVTYQFSDFPDSQVREFGQANQGLFRRINISRITILTNESDAQTVREQIVNQQASFEDMARAHSEDVYAQEGGSMGWTYFYELRQSYEDPDVLENLFDLGAGEVSTVYNSRNGWVIYRVNEPAEQLEIDSDDALQTVRDYMTQFERGVIQDYLSEQAEAFRTAVQETGFAGAAEQQGLSVKETQYFPINYGNTNLFNRVRPASSAQSREQNIFQQAAAREDFFRTLFSLGEDAVTEPVTVQNNIMVFSLVEERQASEDTAEFLANYYPQTVSRFQQQQLQSSLLKQEYITDNFNAAYSRYVGRGQR